MTLARFVFGFSLLALSVSAGTYTTTFPTSESPLSQSGMWVNGSLTGFSKDCAVTNLGGFHYAFGLQPGTNVPPVYDDSVAMLTGTWGPTQALDFTVYFTNQQPSSAGYWEEIEYGLNCVLSNHWFSGYFMDLSLNSDSGYIELGISYNGTNNVGLGGNVYGAQYVVTNGSTLHVGLTNKIISVFLNGHLAVRVTDTTGISIPNGAPCIGFYHQGDNGSRRTDFGISRFSATDFISSPLQITTQSLTNGTVGVPYMAQLTSSGGVPPYQWSLAPGSGPLPGGLSLNAGGMLSGMPTNAAMFGFTARVTDAQSSSADQPLMLTIAAPTRPQPPGNLHIVGL